MKTVDVAIIGAGSGGLSARREVARKTDNYVVIDGGILGTTCARVGCMPSKVFIQVAHDYDRRKKHAEQGILGADALSLDKKQVMSHVRKLRDRFVRGVTGGMEAWESTHLVRKYAKFVDEKTLDLGDEKIQADKIVIATGSTPVIPEIFRPVAEHVITTDQFFEQDTLPGAVAVIGLGVIGIELGQALSRLDVDVIGIARRPNISGVSDPVLNEYVVKKFESMMNLSFEGVQKVAAKDGRVEITTGGKSFVVDKVLVTAGRRPQWNSLNLDCLSFEVDDRGIPLVDKETFQSKTYPHIFIAGDNTGEKQILHEASDEGKIAGYNCVHNITKFQTRTPLYVTFSDPNIAFIGQTFKELTEQKIPFEIGEVTFEGQGRSIVKLKEIGLLRVYGHKETGILLGAELFAPDGEHLAHLLSWVISQKMTVVEVLALPFYHPVVEEGLRTALRDLRSKVDIEIPPLETLLK